MKGLISPKAWKTVKPTRGTVRKTSARYGYVYFGLIVPLFPRSLLELGLGYSTHYRKMLQLTVRESPPYSPPPPMPVATKYFKPEGSRSPILKTQVVPDAIVAPEMGKGS